MHESNGQPVQLKLSASAGRMALQAGPKKVRPFINTAIVLN